MVGGSNCIVIIRVVGNIIRIVSGRLGVFGEGIVSDFFIERIWFVWGMWIFVVFLFEDLCIFV